MVSPGTVWRQFWTIPIRQ